MGTDAAGCIGGGGGGGDGSGGSGRGGSGRGGSGSGGRGSSSIFTPHVADVFTGVLVVAVTFSALAVVVQR